MNSQSPADSRSPAIIARILHLLPWVLVAAEVACVGVYAARMTLPRKISPENDAVLAGVPSAAPPATEKPPGLFTAAEFPEGRLFVTAARGAYQDGGMLLSLPTLDIDGLAVNGISNDATLQSGVGLSDFSQMPAEKLGNVVILGWGGFADPPATSVPSSDASSSEPSSSAPAATFTPRVGKFNGLETLASGDTATLTYGGILYSYAYKDTKTFPEENWEPLYIQGFNCLSLVSPVGNGQSVVVRFELTASEEE